MKRRVIRQKIFLGSTIEEINIAFDSFLEKENICVGNYIDSKLYKLGGVYQFQFFYAKVIEN